MKYQALKKYENKLIECLEGVDLVSLAREAAEYQLVPDEIKDNIKSLHPEVPCPLVCRYLVYHVYSSLIGDQSKFNAWLKVLSSISVRGMARILSELKKYSNGLNSAFGLQKKQVVFTEKQVSDLTEILADCSSYWQEIGTALGLPDNEIRNIRAMMHMNTSIIMCLKEVLSKWVMCKFLNTKPPTLENLEKALQSKIVGLGKEASELKGKLECLLFEIIHDDQLASERFHNLKIIRQTQNEAIAEGNSILLEVKASTSLNHTVGIKWFKGKHQLENPATVQDSYNGCHASILFIKAIDLSAEGTYSCHINDDDNTSIMSDPIFLRVTTSIDSYQRNLVNFYTEQPEVPEDTWPPVSSNTYITLALIKQNSIYHAGEYGRVTIRGDADDIYKDKESLDHNSAFSNLESGTRLLVEGRPGSGKTTLVHKISKDWAMKALAFKQNRLLILVHLRAFSSNPSIDLHDILNCYFQDSAVKQEIVKYSEVHNGLGLCFILDGLDEYSPQNMKDTYIYKLIKRMTLPKAIVLVASRPAAAADFRSVASKRVEVIGFLKNQIFDYVDNYPFSSLVCSKEKGEKLKKYFTEHPNVHHMCYLPIHAAMVCFLFDCLETELPQTETEIYQEFTKFSMLRILYRTKDPSEFHLNSINDLAGSQREVFNKICDLAFEMCRSAKQVMTQDEAQPILSNAKDDNIFQSLVTVDRMAMRCGFQKIYTFLHLTFQEFLGAYHIASLSEEQQFQLIAKFGKVKELQQVWKFYCGLTKFTVEQNKFKALIDNSDHGDIFKIQCAFESQQPLTCDIVVKENVLSLNHNGFLTPSNFAEIAYVFLSNTSRDVPILSFDGCIFGEESAQVLVEKAGDALKAMCFRDCDLKNVNYFLRTLPSLKMLDISNIQIQNKDIETLTFGLNHCNLFVLKVSWANSFEFSFGLPKLLLDAFVPRCCDSFHMYCSGVGRHHRITVYPFHYHTVHPYINLSTIKLGLAGIHAVSLDLVKTSSFTRLTLISCGIDSEAASCLALGLKHCRDLKVLELGFNSIGDDGAVNIAKSLKQFCNKLSLLDLNCNHLSDNSAVVVTDALRGFHVKILLGFNNITQYADIFRNHSDVEFHTLNFSNRDVIAEGCDKMASVIQTCNCRDILKLDLSKNDLAIEPFCSILAQCSNLLILDLSSSFLGVKGARILSSALKHCAKLHNLDISSNSLSAQDLALIAESIKSCCNLLQLKINCNRIKSEGVFTLVEKLRSCCILQELEIHSNDIQCGGAKALAHALSHRYWNLYVLDISSNVIASDGIRSLANGLKNCTTLQELYVSHNSLQSSDAKFLALALKCFTKFRVLDISYNNLRTSGAKAIGDALRHCTSLYTLNISHNDIGREGRQHLVDAHQQWTRLCRVII